MNKILAGTCIAVFLTIAFASESQHPSTLAQGAQAIGTVSVAVGPKYDTTHVYVAPQGYAPSP